MSVDRVSVRRTGSLQSVLDAMSGGTSTVGELASATGLDVDLVRLALDRLVALGRITSDRASTSCPPAGCGGCAIAGCAGGPSAAPTLLTLATPPPT